jgi:glyoxylase-like metal-dependent hydrolase (beta-lactamase superfamily II)
VTHKDENLGLIVVQTPGHVPDELAIWDPFEHVLFVGDSIYEWAPIVFPREGNLVIYSHSMGKLRRLVKSWNADGSGKRVTMACGHCTTDADAEELLSEVDEFLWNVVCGKVKVSREDENRGEVYLLYERKDGRLSFLGPRRLFEVFKEDNEAMNELRKRVED